MYGEPRQTIIHLLEPCTQPLYHQKVSNNVSYIQHDRLFSRGNVDRSRPRKQFCHGRILAKS